MRKLLPVLLCTFFLLLIPAAAADVAGSGDHPLVERIAGSRILSFDRNEFRGVALPSGPWDQSAREYLDTVNLEGEWIWMVYGFEDPEISALRVHRSFLARLPAAGFELIFEAGDMDLIQGARRGRPISSSARPGIACCWQIWC